MQAIPHCTIAKPQITMSHHQYPLDQVTVGERISSRKRVRIGYRILRVDNPGLSTNMHNSRNIHILRHFSKYPRRQIAIITGMIYNTTTIRILTIPPNPKRGRPQKSWRTVHSDHRTTIVNLRIRKLGHLPKSPRITHPFGSHINLDVHPVETVVTRQIQRTIETTIPTIYCQESEIAFTISRNSSSQAESK